MGIEISNLSFGYDDDYILKNVNLSINKGYVYILLGKNGVGKTTLMKLILGIKDFSSGEIHIDERNLKTMKRAGISKKIAYVPQSADSKVDMKVIDYVLSGRNPYVGLFDKPTQKDYHLSESALKESGAYHLRDKQFGNLSGGEKQLVLLSRAICQDTDYIVLDEPVANLDIKNQHDVFEILNRLANEKGKGIILSVHNPNLAYKFSDFAIMLSESRVLGAGTVEEVMNESMLKKVYDMDFQLIKHNGQNLIIC